MIVVYRYNCWPPSAGEQAMSDQLRKMNDFWNKLVELDNRFRERYNSLLAGDSSVAELAAEFERVAAEIESVRKDILERRRRARRNVDVTPLVEKLNNLRARRRELASGLKLAKSQAKTLLSEQRAALNAERKEAEAELRRQVTAEGLWWGNVDEVWARYQAARARAKGMPLKFHRFTGEGSVSLHIQGGLPTSEIWNPGRQLIKIDPVDPRAFESPSRGERRRLGRTKVYFRVGSSGGDPVWLELPIMLHRPLPPGLIKQAKVTRRRVGTHYYYQLHLTIDAAQSPTRPVSSEIAGVDLAWRKTSDGLRVAYVSGSDGREEPIVLPEKIERGLKKAEELRSLRDRLFNEMRDRLPSLLPTGVPDWLREAVQAMPQWRSPARLAVLALRWRESRFAGDDEAYRTLEAWRKQDKHLYEWEANARRKALEHRRQFYRELAKKLATSYGVVAVEDMDLRELAARPAPEEPPRGEEYEPAHLRFIVGPSELRLAIKQACAKYGALYVEAPSALTTQRCHACGKEERFDTAAHLYHRCSHCKALWDQDLNAAINLRKWAEGALEGDAGTEDARGA